MEPTVYEMVGGTDDLRRLVEVFYRKVHADPILIPIFPRLRRELIENLTLFLAEFFGGPKEYSRIHGHPRLRMRHAKFRIGQVERDAWLRHMLAAMDEVGIPEPPRGVMRSYFERSAAFLINAQRRRRMTDDEDGFGAKGRDGSALGGDAGD